MILLIKHRARANLVVSVPHIFHQENHISFATEKVFCDECNNGIISHSKKCIFCELKKQKNICTKCPLVIKEGKTIYCVCGNIGGGRVHSHNKKLVSKYAFGMDNSVLDIYLNTSQNELLTLHGY